MKSIKKYILIIAAALLTVTLSACKNVTAEEAINKSAEISKNIKNTEFKSFTTSEYITGKDPRKKEATITGTIINEPFSIHASVEAKADKPTSFELYIQGKALYEKVGSEPWKKDLYSSYLFERYQNISKTEKRMEFYKKVAKDFKLVKENDTYVLTYSGSGDQFSDFATSIVEASARQLNPYSVKDVEFKSVNIKYVISKDFTPISNEVTMEVVSKIIPKAKTLKITQKITYSNVNKVNSIDLPEEVKNAKGKFEVQL